MKKKVKVIKHNPFAMILSHPLFKHKVVKSKKNYDRNKMKITIRDYSQVVFTTI